MENLKHIEPLSDFDWDAFENGTVTSTDSKEEQEKAYDSTLGRVNENEVVEGTVISINKREVVVNIGYKSDGIIPVSEFRYNPDLKFTLTIRKTSVASSYSRTRRLVPASLGSVSMQPLRARKSSRVTSSAARRAV